MTFGPDRRAIPYHSESAVMQRQLRRIRSKQASHEDGPPPLQGTWRDPNRHRSTLAGEIVLRGLMSCAMPWAAPWFWFGGWR